MEALGGGPVSYERGTPVGHTRAYRLFEDEKLRGASPRSCRVQTRNPTTKRQRAETLNPDSGHIPPILTAGSNLPFKISLICIAACRNPDANEEA